MIRRPMFSAILAVGLLVLAAPVTQAAADVLSVIPGDALGFVVVNRLGDADAKIQAVGKQMQISVPSVLMLLKAQAGIVEGLDEKGSAAIAIMRSDDEGSEPSPLVFVPVTDFGKFVASMKPDDPSAAIVKVTPGGGSALVGKIGRYAVFAEPGQRETLERALKGSTSVAADVAPLRPWLAENDVAGVMTSHGVKLLCETVSEGLQEAKAVVEGMGDESNPALAILGLYEQFFGSLEKEVSAVALGAQLDGQGVLRVTSRTRLTPTGDLAGCVAEFKPTRTNLLASLPGGPFVGALGTVIPEGSGEAMMQFSADMMKAMRGFYGLSDEQVDKLMAESEEYWEGMRGMAVILGVGESDDPLYSNLLFVMSVDDAQAFLRAYGKQLDGMEDLLKGVSGPISWTMESEKVEVGGLPTLKVVMEIRPAGMEGVPDFDQMMEKMFGPGGKMTFYLTAANKNTVVGAYTTEKSLLRAIEAVKQPQASLSADQSVAKTTAMLPPGAPMVGYWSPAGTMSFVNRAISLFSPGPQFGFRLPDFPKTPPIGFAVTTAPNELQTHMVVPAEVLKAIGVYVDRVKQSMAGPF